MDGSFKKSVSIPRVYTGGNCVIKIHLINLSPSSIFLFLTRNPKGAIFDFWTMFSLGLTFVIGLPSLAKVSV